MIFTHPRKHASYNPQSVNGTTIATPVFSVRRYQASISPVVAAPPPPPPVPEPPKPKQMKWGEPTWYFLHTIAEKIKPESFDATKTELFEIIRTVCRTLPCPDCARHATEYMDKINFYNIRTKTDLQKMLWGFHNEVNQRKGFPIFPYESLGEKYSRAITRNIIQEFIRVHEDKHASFRMIADDFYRTKITASLRAWFIANIQLFDE
jgi:hypothetical protein